LLEEHLLVDLLDVQIELQASLVPGRYFLRLGLLQAYRIGVIQSISKNIPVE
jgi:hypothetical protein